MTEPLADAALKTEFLLKTFGPFETWSDMDLCMIKPGFHPYSLSGSQLTLDLYRELTHAQRELADDIELMLTFTGRPEGITGRERRLYLRGKAIIAWNEFSKSVCNHK